MPPSKRPEMHDFLKNDRIRVSQDYATESVRGKLGYYHRKSEAMKYHFVLLDGDKSYTLLDDQEIERQESE